MTDCRIVDGVKIPSDCETFDEHLQHVKNIELDGITFDMIRCGYGNID